MGRGNDPWGRFSIEARALVVLGANPKQSASYRHLDLEFSKIMSGKARLTYRASRNYLKFERR